MWYSSAFKILKVLRIKYSLSASWMTSYFKIKFFFWIRFWLRLVSYVILHICVFNFILTYWKTLKKMEKTFQVMTLYRTLTCFFFFERKNLFLSPYRWKRQYRRKWPISPIFFGNKLSAILGLPLQSLLSIECAYSGYIFTGSCSNGVTRFFILYYTA